MMNQRTLLVSMVDILALIASTSVLIVLFYVSVVDAVNQANLRIMKAVVTMQNTDCDVWDLAGSTLYCKTRAVDVEGPVT